MLKEEEKSGREGEEASKGRMRTESTTSVLPMCSPNEHRLKEGFSSEDLEYDLYSIAV